METLSIFSPKVCPLCIQELIVHNVAKSYLKLHLKFYAPIFSTFLFVKLKSMSDNKGIWTTVDYGLVLEVRQPIDDWKTGSASIMQ